MILALRIIYNIDLEKEYQWGYLMMTSSTSLGACAIAGPAAPACISIVSKINAVTGGNAALACTVNTIQSILNKCVDAHLKQVR